eukprot:TRINITY_DN6533_c0_g1_i1.p1 TRINITY_DN6533_c0_g1~~TRINITY_DN6533_c0_g1_i1.p1  ORF type:complete len:335 (+),score=82.82 TRINITY_DN6533_c0_g1_i1:51-1055(+)
MATVAAVSPQASANEVLATLPGQGEPQTSFMTDIRPKGLQPSFRSFSAWLWMFLFRATSKKTWLQWFFDQTCGRRDACEEMVSEGTGSTDVSDVLLVSTEEPKELSARCGAAHGDEPATPLSSVSTAAGQPAEELTPQKLTLVEDVSKVEEQLSAEGCDRISEVDAAAVNAEGPSIDIVSDIRIQVAKSTEIKPLAAPAPSAVSSRCQGGRWGAPPLSAQAAQGLQPKETLAEKLRKQKEAETGSAASVAQPQVFGVRLPAVAPPRRRRAGGSSEAASADDSLEPSPAASAHGWKKKHKASWNTKLQRKVAEQSQRRAEQSRRDRGIVDDGGDF